MRSVIAALIVAFNLLLDPKLLVRALWPMLASVVLWTGAAIFLWGRCFAALTSLFESAALQKVIGHTTAVTLSHYVAGLLLFMLLLAVIYLTALVITAFVALPAVVAYVAETYYPELEPTHGSNIRGTIENTLVAVAVYCAGWVVSLPFWLFSPLALVLPVLLGAYLNQRLFRYDVLSEYASPREFAEVVQRSSKRLYALGAVAGMLQFVPLLNLFAPIYAVLAFAHLCLGELTRMRETT